MAPPRGRPLHGETSPEDLLARWEGERGSARELFESLLNERENELLSAASRTGPNSKAYQNAQRGLHDADTMLTGIQRVVFRPLNKYHIRWYVFAAFALALALLEAPVNKFLFDVALQSIGIFSFLASTILALCLLILAHLAGKSIRQVWSEFGRRIVWSSLLVFLLIVAVLFLVVGILTIGRALSSAAAIASFQDMFAAVRSNVVEQGFWGAVRASFSDVSALILATVNIGGIFAALMLAYFTHDPDKDYDAAYDTVERYRGRLDRLETRFADAKDAIIQKYAIKLTVAGARFNQANKHVVELKHRLKRSLNDPNDTLIIDKLDTLAEESEHADSIGAESPSAHTTKGGGDAPEPSRPVTNVRFGKTG